MWYFSFPQLLSFQRRIWGEKKYISYCLSYFSLFGFPPPPPEKLRAMIENVYRLIQNLQNWYNGGKQSILIRKNLMHLISNVHRTLHSAREN